jgi:hypothetical protein
VSLLGFILILSGILIGRFAIRQAILAAQLGKLSEEGREECPYPNELSMSAGGPLSLTEAARLAPYLHEERL